MPVSVHCQWVQTLGCAGDQTQVSVLSLLFSSVLAQGLHLISKFIFKVCHLSCELLLGFLSGAGGDGGGGETVDEGVRIGWERGESVC